MSAARLVPGWRQFNETAFVPGPEGSGEVHTAPVPLVLFSVPGWWNRVLPASWVLAARRVAAGLEAERSAALRVADRDRMRRRRLALRSEAAS